MKRLALCIFALAIPAGAQTIDPSQIRACATNGQVLQTQSGVTQCENLPAGVTLQHNGTNLTDQSLLNFLDAAPSLPSGYQSVTFSSNSGGGLGGYVPNTANVLAGYLVPPTSGQYVTLCAGTSGGTTTDSHASYSAGSCGGGGTAYGIIAGAPHTATVTWSNYSLPSYVSPGNVSAVYIAFLFSSQESGIGSWTFVCNSQSINVSSITATKQFSALLTGVTGSNIGSVSCTLSVSASAFTGTDFTAVSVPEIKVFAFYTGTAPPVQNLVSVQPPLHWDTINQILSLDVPADTGIDTGTTNHYQVTMASAPLLIPGLTVKFLPGNASTSTTPTLSVNGSTAGTIVGPQGGALSSGDMTSTSVATVILESTGSTPIWSLQNPQVSGSGAVTAVSNSDSTLTVSPTTGAVVASLNLSHANTWTAKQTMPSPILSDQTGGGTLCLQVNNSGQVGVAAGACGTGSGGDTITSPNSTITVGGTSTNTTLDTAPVGTVVDTSTPVTVSTALPAQFHFNQNATAATAVTYNLPTAAAGKQFCFKNSYNGSAGNTGALTIQTSASGQYLINAGVLSASDGYIVSGGALGDAACVVGVDSTHWSVYVGAGTWTLH